MQYIVEPRGAGSDLLHAVVSEGFPELVGRLAARDRHLPAHVASELQRFLSCGDPADGFAWLVCDDCEHQRLVPFSCKGRAFCPSCCGRRMAASSARWVDAMFPYRRVRQWVLTVPWPRRWLFARRHDLARGVLRLAIEEVRLWYADRCGIPDGQTGAVTVVQRFGSALNLNVHFHIIAIDGVYGPAEEGELHFRSAPNPPTGDVEALIERIAKRCEAWLASRGHAPEDGEASEDDTQAVLHAAAVAGRSAFEERRRRTQRVGGREMELPPQCAAYEGYTLHAGVSIGAKDREGLERLCRYVLRPPLAKSRLVALEDGRVALVLRRPWSDGTTEKVFTRGELVERLAALVPPRQSNQVLYHGVFAARSKLRALVVPRRAPRPKTKRLVRPERRAKRRGRWEPWAELLRRVFGGDGFRCPHCAGLLRLRTVVVGPPATTTILRDLSRGTAVPP